MSNNGTNLLQHGIRAHVRVTNHHTFTRPLRTFLYSTALQFYLVSQYTKRDARTYLHLIYHFPEPRLSRQRRST